MAKVSYNRIDGTIPDQAQPGNFLVMHKTYGPMLARWQESGNQFEPGAYIACGFADTATGFARPVGQSPFQFVILREEQLALIEWHAHLGEL